MRIRHTHNGRSFYKNLSPRHIPAAVSRPPPAGEGSLGLFFLPLLAAQRGGSRDRKVSRGKSWIWSSASFCTAYVSMVGGTTWLIELCDVNIRAQ